MPCHHNSCYHHNDVMMSSIAFQITSRTIVYLTFYSAADQRKYQSSASLSFVWGIHRRPVNSPHKGQVTRKMFPFDDVIMHLMVLGHLKTKWWRSTGSYSNGTSVIAFYVLDNAFQQLRFPRHSLNQCNADPKTVKQIPISKDNHIFFVIIVKKYINPS